MKHAVGKIAFVSPHGVLDCTNGAATATLDGLSVLARLGFECQAFSGSWMDAWEEVHVEEMVAQRGVSYMVRNAQVGGHHCRMIFTSHSAVPITLIKSTSTRGGWISPAEMATFLSGCDAFLRRFRPSLVWTYGGDPVSILLHKLVRELGIQLLFTLHNFEYRGAALFAQRDHVIVPTEFARCYYHETIGLECNVLPLVMDRERVRVDRTGTLPVRETTIRSLAQIHHSDHKSVSMAGHENRLAVGDKSYVTFVNPEPRKGVHVFARIVEILSRRRPEIPFLVVEGAAKASFLSALRIDLSGLKNVTTMPNTPDPRIFYAVTKMILMPSLMENAGYVAMEAMTNGIPVLASNRGALPETIGDAAPMFEIPPRYTQETRELPTADEIEPWVETIIRLWDDTAEYERWSHAARKRSQRWSAEHLAPIYCEYFGDLCQSSPPLTPPEDTG